MATFSRTLLSLFALIALAAMAPAASSFIVPDMPDLRIKTRQIYDGLGANARAGVTTEIAAFKGARQRREHLVEYPGRPGVPRPMSSSVRIIQCDDRRTLQLSDVWRTYAYEPITDMAAEAARMRAAIARRPQPPPAEIAAAAVVTITVDAADTGERRAYGSYTARHIITTKTTAPGPGAHMSAAVDITDGWYLDLPEENCQDRDTPIYTIGVGFVRIPGSPSDRVEYKHHGPVRHGFTIEESHRSSRNRVSPLTNARIELLEISEAPLDDALFTVPSGYRPALPIGYGGHDMTRPDTLMNRITVYEQMIANWANRLFDFRPRSY